MAFKVGDTGKTRDGRDYIVASIDDGFDRPVRATIMSADGLADIYHFSVSGRRSTLSEDGVDLMTPVSA